MATETDDKTVEVLEELVKHPELFPTFSEEMAAQVREELSKALKEAMDKTKSDRC